MAGKGVRAPLSIVMMVIVILGLIVAETRAGTMSCCRSTSARNCYRSCRLSTSEPICAQTCDCIYFDGRKCPPNYPKLGSASSMSSFQNSDVAEVAIDVAEEAVDVTKEAVKEAVERCNNACSEVCTKGSAAVDSA